ncbi:MAG TPA: hypothetical protein VGI96_06585 [Streptosporangiaceae bacterium]
MSSVRRPGIAAGGSRGRPGLPGLAAGGQDDLDGALGCPGLEVPAADQDPAGQRAGAEVGDEGVADAGRELAAGDAAGQGLQTGRRRGAMYWSRQVRASSGPATGSRLVSCLRGMPGPRSGWLSRSAGDRENLLPQAAGTSCGHGAF